MFIHGLGGQWQNWLENIPRFAQDRRVIVPDLPGFGLSPMPGEDISIEYYGRVIAELCDALGLGPAVVVGNSMGGYIASQVAIERPDLVERLMLVSAAGVSQMEVAKGPVMAVTKAIGLFTAMTVAQLPAVARRPRTRHWALLLVARYPGKLASDFAFEGLMKGTGKPGFVDAMQACLEYDLRDRLPSIGCPTLVVWGEKDMTIPVAGRRQVHRADQGLAQADHGGHRPRVHGRAAGDLQRPPAGVPVLRGRRGRARGRAQPVSAPWAAEPTSFEYFASTPWVYSGSGDS